MDFSEEVTGDPRVKSNSQGCVGQLISKLTYVSMDFKATVHPIMTLKSLSTHLKAEGRLDEVSSSISGVCRLFEGQGRTKGTLARILAPKRAL